MDKHPYLRPVTNLCPVTPHSILLTGSSVIDDAIRREVKLNQYKADHASESSGNHGNEMENPTKEYENS